MLILALLLPICYVAGYTGASIPTQWVLLSLSLPLSLWRTGSPLLVLPWLGGLFMLWIAINLIGTQNIYTTVLGLWYLFIWALAFRWGTALFDLHAMWQGLAIGLSISSLIALAQTFGLHFPATDATDFHGRAPGLLFNPVIQGCAIGIVIVGLAGHRLYAYMPLLFLGLTLSLNRGGWLIIGLSAVARFAGWWAAIGLLLAAALVLSALTGDSDHQRLQIWGIAIAGLTPWGWGPDSFNDVYAIIPDAYGPHINHLEFAHNDYLQLAFEYGIGAIFPIAILACGLSRTAHPEWPALFACAIASCFFFPLYHPLTGFIYCILAGHLAADWNRVWAVRIRGRFAQLPRYAFVQRLARIDR